MRSAIAGFVIGIAWLQFQAKLPDYIILLLLFAGAILAGGLSRWSRWSTFSFALRLICGALLGVVWASLFALYYLKHELPNEWEGRDITLVGTIDSLPYSFERGVRFNFAVERAIDGGAEVIGVPPKVALSWHAGFGTESSQPVPEVKPGERWQLTVRLKAPHGASNPVGFDYELWLWEQGVQATGYVRAGSRDAAPERLGQTLGHPVEQARQSVRDAIFQRIPDRQQAGLVAALVVGDQNAIDRGDRH